MVLVKVCDICSREFETLFESKKHCSLRCINEKGRIYRKEKADRLRELEEENKELRKQLRELENK
jgi:hypothetical protein